MPHRSARRPVAAPALIRPHRHALDVPGPQRPTGMEQTALDDRGVPDHLPAVPHERVDAAQRVIPVAIAHLVAEDVVEQRPRGAEGVAAEVGGVGQLERGRHERKVASRT